MDDIGDKLPFGVSKLEEPNLSEPIADNNGLGDWIYCSKPDDFRKVLCWNCRGAKAKGLSGLIYDFCHNADVSLLILLEPQVSGVVANKIIKKFRFDGETWVDSISCVGGIWVLWDQSLWKTNVLHSAGQFITMEVQWMDDTPCFLTAVYGSPHMARRAELWTHIHQMAACLDGPRCLIGDFNVVAFEHERLGSSSQNPPRGSTNFAHLLSDCELTDLGFIGSPFTWSRGNLRECLDKAVATLPWHTRFPHANVTYLFHFKSDHSPYC
ncbi:PREDICTED: uncharacterized protein LOC109329268 [Lupinus angustifolius]|uniref:uncharacterized protein LOC109329268 n=1 Tax=Lupinus angustifolius TaxID=3871 RepID=UPI00092EF315|nr:PREDICTED: uncharacterized protein LOC109329268 [Lupinus angustifolius]